ncbi:hypothetical protein CTRI78_v006156 [Colletotrichum trifolii]|uniref:Secreted protein n=1 Tax=Colletotrichum trifolii TaxID=5466 RepID=A0A4R8RD19_COLTR|nr:hypothetical protein CTRI78_v006156 [Colletotrichum trifolii]
MRFSYTLFLMAVPAMAAPIVKIPIPYTPDRPSTLAPQGVEAVTVSLPSHIKAPMAISPNAIDQDNPSPDLALPSETPPDNLSKSEDGKGPRKSSRKASRFRTIVARYDAAAPEANVKRANDRKAAHDANVKKYNDNQAFHASRVEKWNYTWGHYAVTRKPGDPVAPGTPGTGGGHHIQSCPPGGDYSKCVKKPPRK